MSNCTKEQKKTVDWSKLLRGNVKDKEVSGGASSVDPCRRQVKVMRNHGQTVRMTHAVTHPSDRQWRVQVLGNTLRDVRVAAPFDKDVRGV